MYACAGPRDPQPGRKERVERGSGGAQPVRAESVDPRGDGLAPRSLLIALRARIAREGRRPRGSREELGARGPHPSPQSRGRCAGPRGQTAPT